MITRTAVTATLLLAAASLAACKKGEDSADNHAAKPTEVAQAAPKAATPAAPTKLAQVGVTLDLPAGASIDEQKQDMGGVQATISYEGMPNFFVSNVGDGSDSVETIEKHADAKAWKSQTKNPDGTFNLSWSKADGVKFGVAVRAKVGAKLIDCGGNGLSEDQATALLKVCGSLKP